MRHLVSAITLLCLLSFPLTSSFAQTSTTPTVITVGTTVQQTGVKRLGVNLGNQTYFDSRQMMNNLLFRNPGFEGEMWQSVIHCMAVTSNSCTDDKASSAWPANFFQNATVEVLSGASLGVDTTVTSNTAAVYASGLGIALTFPNTVNLAVGDYLAVRMLVPGNGTAGWSTRVSGTGTVTTETTDLSPNTVGKQAVQLSAPGTSLAQVTSYFDSASRSFLQLNGTYTLSLRAKLVSGSAKALTASVSRINTGVYLQTIPTLTGAWQDLSFTFTASETNAAGTVQAILNSTGGVVLVDDVSLTKTQTADNPTAFRDEVVSTLRTLNPGVLRYMDNGTDWGSSIDNMLVPAMARLRAGYNNYYTESDDIPIGLHEFMVLCQAVGTEPWYTMPAGMSVAEMQNLMDYLGGSTSTPYGARRAALGQAAPWTTVFPGIHLEFGNEVWNTANPGASFTDATAYGKRAGVLFTAAKASPSYSPVVDLIIDGWESAPVWTKPALAASTKYDTISQAAYFYGPFTDDSSIEAIYGSMFSMPEQINSTAGGLLVTRVKEANAATLPAKTAIYESNIGAINGTVSQATLSQVIPSVGAGIATAENLLTLVRDQGVKYMNLFTLAQYGVGFSNTSSGVSESVPLYGTLIDMGGPTNLRRPSFLAAQLANQAIRPTLLATSQSGNNPTWAQVAKNGANAIAAAHYLQSIAFTDGSTNALVLFNLSRTTALPVTFAGSNAPTGSVAVSTLTSSAITDTNENSDVVKIAESSLSAFDPTKGITLPPFSMTVLTHTSPTVASLAVACTPNPVQVGATTTCAPTVTGTGTFSTGVTWATSLGSISAAGVYSAPASLPTTTTATITATSAQDTTRTASQVITVNQPVTITAVTVGCGSSSIGVSTSTLCRPTVTGTGIFNSAVTWSVSGGGSISQAALFSAPATSANVVITATSVQDPTKFGTFAVNVGPPVISSVALVCASNALQVGGSTQCTPTVTGISGVTNTVNWSATLGTVSSTGVYTAPTSIPVSQSITITARASQDNTKSASWTIALNQPVAVTGVTISCPFTTVPLGSTDACTANVTGTGPYSTAVTWSSTGGSVTQTGVATLPASASSITVRAVSVADPTKFATIALTSSATPVLATFTVTNLTATSATIHWVSNTPTLAGYDYGPNYSISVIDTTKYVTSASFTINGLTAGTTYKGLAFGYSTAKVFGSLQFAFTTPAK